MDCFQDFCLYCDRDSPEGAYCSQKCKLADLERANQSQPMSPISPTTQRSEQSWRSSKKQSLPSYEAPSPKTTRPSSSYFMWNPSYQLPEQDERQLTPSSSRTSLSSTNSASSVTSPPGISSQARQQLQEYFSSFDQARAAKRRSSTR